MNLGTIEKIYAARLLISPRHHLNLRERFLMRGRRIFVVRARPGTIDSLNLGNPPQPSRALLVGNFHTHPTLSSQGGDPNQSYGDLQSEVFRGVPGLIRNENGITPYGPNKRGSNPELALYRDPAR